MPSKKIEATWCEIYDKFVDDAWFIGRSTLGGLPEEAYLGLCIAGEAGEVLDKVVRDFPARPDIIDERGLILELGDLLYYVTRYLHKLDTALTAVIQYNAVRENLCKSEVELPIVVIATMHVSCQACAISERLKKAYRDSSGKIDRIAMIGTSATVVLYIEWCALLIGMKLEDVARWNVTKLKDRAERGVMRGEGDDR